MSDIQKKSNRIEWIDTAKGIGLLLVIFGHLHVPYLSTWIYFFHMPLFFFLSGAVYSGKKYTFKEYLIKRVKSLIIPYISFGVVIWVFYAIVNLIIGSENGLYGTNLEMLKELLIQKHFWTIWFLTALFLTEIIYYVIDRYLGKNLVVTSIISIAVCIFGLLRYRLGLGALPWNLDISLVAQFFFHVGRLFRNSIKLQGIVFASTKKRTIFFISLFFLLNVLFGELGIKISHASLDMSIGSYGNEFLTIISAIFGILFVISIANLFTNTFLQYLGKNTMVIFAWHSRIVIVWCDYIYKRLDIFQDKCILEQLVYTLVTFTIILLILIPVTELIKRSKLRCLFGV